MVYISCFLWSSDVHLDSANERQEHIQECGRSRVQVLVLAFFFVVTLLAVAVSLGPQLLVISPSFKALALSLIW